jgi:hypothetical protein
VVKARASVQAIGRVYVPKITFIGEQDGEVERTMKARWLPILAAHPEIRRAFLVRAAYEEQQDVHVMLAPCSNGPGDVKVIESLRVPYAGIFSRDCPLDMAFVTSTQQSEIERVRPPFYTAINPAELARP